MPYLTPQHWEAGTSSRFPNPLAPLTGTSGIVSRLMRDYVSAHKSGSGETFGAIAFHPEIPSSIRAELVKRFPGCPAPGAESAVVVAGANLDVYAPGERGLLYAAQDIIGLTGPAGLPEGFLYDYPVCPVRGVKLLLPAADRFGDFKKFVDLLCRYKYNTLMLEIGGAMEYKRHPEINAAWIDYCREMNEYPGKGTEIQEKFGFRKNSIHSGNGGGGVLSQAQVRELLAYCRERLFDIVPEEPTLSHCDYLLQAHKELAERQEDPYPDTYCPMQEGSYKLVFDLLDEVIDVFEPDTVNIGHDEFYSFKRCDRCRPLAAPRIYADDIIRIQAYLKARGVNTMIWGEKLLDAHFLDGRPCGGAGNEEFDATYPAIALVPKDLRILHWYWGIDRNLEARYRENGLSVIYGNFEGPAFMEWKKRSSEAAIRGFVISNWGTTDFQTLQRNAILFNVVYSAFLAWNRAFDDAHFEKLRALTFLELEHARGLDLIDRDVIAIRHTTDLKMDYVSFVDGTYIDNRQYEIGHYELSYEEGPPAEIPVIYGLNIGARDLDWERTVSNTYDTYASETRLMEAAYSTVPEKTEDGIWYRHRFANPRPGKRVTRIRFVQGRPGVTVWFERLPA